MSGGSYGYFYMKIDEFLDDLEYHCRRSDDSVEVVTLRSKLIEHFVKLKAVCQELEWYDSADSSCLDKTKAFIEELEKCQ